MFNDNVSLEKCPALVLNADYRPLSYYPLSLDLADSIKSVFLNRVSIVVIMMCCKKSIFCKITKCDCFKRLYQTIKKSKFH